MNFGAFALATVTIVSISAPAAGQEISFVPVFGPSVVAGFYERHVVDNPYPIAGAGKHGVFAGLQGLIHSHGRLTHRAEVFYNRLTSAPNTYAVDVKKRYGSVPMAREDEVWAVSLGSIATFRSAELIQPFLSGGLAVHHARLGSNKVSWEESVNDVRSGTSLGYNLGFGVAFGPEPLKIYLETRVHHSFGQVRGSGFIPVTVGVAVPIRRGSQ